MATTYRVDYATDAAPDKPVVVAAHSRDAALVMARQLSAKAHVGFAYAIRTDDGKDTGQRVYCGGVYSHTDDVF